MWPSGSQPRFCAQLCVRVASCQSIRRLAVEPVKEELKAENQMDKTNTSMPVDDVPPASATVVDPAPTVPQAATTVSPVVLDYPSERGSAAAVEGSTKRVAAPQNAEEKRGKGKRNRSPNQSRSRSDGDAGQGHDARKRRQGCRTRSSSCMRRWGTSQAC